MKNLTTKSHEKTRKEERVKELYEIRELTLKDFELFVLIRAIR